ncbi:GHKL domain-containing protein [Bacillus sp. FJAT-42315]|uniref:GHKL domain-containing protein n=1 Tax=Bacillus sp. FJAT-42315 TaxID=2014077 RepID=UPI000C24E42E|nr:GHKL domain-containing protein [Bacillus sp. FJAT-42315]
MIDMLVFFIIGLCHIVFYVYLIGYPKFSWGGLILLSFFMTVFLVFLVSYTGYPEFNAIIPILFLLCIGLLKYKQGLTIVQSFYFASMSLFIISLAKTIIPKLLLELWLLSDLSLYASSFSIIHLLSASFILLIVVVKRESINHIADYLIQSPFYYISYVSLLLGNFLLIILSSPSMSVLNTFNQKYSDLSYVISLLLFLVLLFFFFLSSHLFKEKVIQARKETAEQELLSYTEKLEVMHEELASFRHDYLNLLLSLDEGVRARNIDLVEQVYNDIIKPTSTIMNHKELELVKLARIKVPEIKSIISVKVIAAHQKNVSVIIDTPHDIDRIYIELVDFIRAISIIVDNAVEEASLSEKRELTIAFFEMDGEQKFIVKNSCRQKSIKLSEIYQKNVSSKLNDTGDRGYGLFSLKRIVDSTPIISLETVFEYPYFTQILSVKYRPLKNENGPVLK